MVILIASFKISLVKYFFYVKSVNTNIGRNLYKVKPSQNLSVPT